MDKEASDLSGQKFHRYTVIKRVRHSERKVFYLCRCDCGTERIVQKGNLVNGNSRSCGCLKREESIARFTTHHATGTPEHMAWLRMRQRCINPKTPDYPNYGGRGITCDPAFDDFAVFLKEIGLRPSPIHSLNRINNERGYEPGNVEWSTKIEQMNNTRRNIKFTYGGETLPLSTWARRMGLKRSTLSQRIYVLKWDLERALTTPTQKWSS
ncbi:MAG TPA: hypothetical protein VNH18_28135 [Bryobacteraceae bacterium]|nr:hypothetical protein [Bryobacteraceae bacterium]